MGWKGYFVWGLTSGQRPTEQFQIKKIFLVTASMHISYFAPVMVTTHAEDVDCRIGKKEERDQACRSFAGHWKIFFQINVADDMLNNFVAYSSNDMHT